jgi:KaiC/GvpD/RAD55 family RecA-like ATPase
MSDGVENRNVGNSAITPLMFGIPQLDELLGYHTTSGSSANRERGKGDGDGGRPKASQLYDTLSTSTSLTIVGEDGTGKSLFALHVAAAYAAIHYRATKDILTKVSPSPPRIVYASSDYRLEAAQRVWSQFYLDFPWHRYIPGIDEVERDFRTKELKLLLDESNHSYCGLNVRLSECRLDVIATQLLGIESHAKEPPPGVGKRPWCTYDVNFVDLSKETSGDDWRFLTNLVAALPRNLSAHEPPSLLVVDSVAGFETFVGKTNTFGDESTRRGRISQLLRAAGESWHVVFLAEEPDQIKHHPEEYVTDTVFHLHRTGTEEKVHRYLEIEKCRASNYAQGEHQFEIRDGKGTSTRSWENPDDLRVSLHPEFRNSVKDLIVERDKTNAYIQVFPSLHYLSKKFGSRHSLLGSDAYEQHRDLKPFGVKYLDEMLRPSGETSRRGLRPATVTAIIGEEGTRKIFLAEQFLVAAYEDLPEILHLFINVSETFRKQMSQHEAGFEEVDLEIGWKFIRLLEQEGRAFASHFFTCQSASSRDEASSQPFAIRTETTARRLKQRFEPQKPGAPAFFYSEYDLKRLSGILREHLVLRDPMTGPSIENPGPLEPGDDAAPLQARWVLDPYLGKVPDSTVGAVPASAEDMDLAETLALAFSALRLPLGVLAPTVFVATHDISSENIADRAIYKSKGRLRKVLEHHKINDTVRQDKYLGHLRRVLESWITVRRAELADCTAPQLWHVIECAAVQGMTKLGYTSASVRSTSEPSPLTDEVRVVISDLRLLRDTYPAITEDSLFLATVVFRLKRYGVTAVIVESENARLDQTQIVHPMSGALRSLVDQQINTWKVNFFGEERVAITALPSLGTSNISLIRELRFAEPFEVARDPMTRVARPELIVDPLFEIFENIEEGHPRAIPLRVQLYGETPAFEQYVNSEREAFKLIFAPENRQDPEVLRIAATSDYQAFRDYIHLPTGRRLPFSLVMMIDGFWALGRKNTLRNQWDYLFSELPSVEQDRFEDPFRLFVRESHGQKTEYKENRASFFRLPAIQTESEHCSKGVREGAGQYDQRADIGFKGVDRVPFMWDFGFLMLNLKQWKNAAQSKLRNKDRNGHDIYVNDVLKDLTYYTSSELLRRCSQESHNNECEDTGECSHVGADRGKQKCPPFENVSWRNFFEACTLVAATEASRTGKQCRSFDVAMTTPDLLACLLFEIWLSEIVKDMRNFKRVADRIEDQKTLATIRKRMREWVDRAEGFLRPMMTDKYLFERGAQSSLKDAIQYHEWDLNCDIRENASEYEQYFGLRGRDPDFLTLRKFLLLEKIAVRQQESGSEVHEIRLPQGYPIQLYQAWLLLLEVMDFRAFEECQWSFELACNRSPDPSSPAVRHWYKTACASAKSEQREGTCNCGNGETMIPVRLPGHFSVRGDWFLATAEGSRSGRLAAQAIDLLCSRRANRTRLHLGLGLPVRDLTAGEEFLNLRTGLSIHTTTGHYRPICGDILNLGGTFLWEVEAGHSGWVSDKKQKVAGGAAFRPPSKANAEPDSAFYWLVRSGIRDYDRQAVVISRWIQRLFEWTVQVRFEETRRWKGGFDPYDELEAGDTSNCRKFESWQRFFKTLRVFAADLAAAAQGAEPISDS